MPKSKPRIVDAIVRHPDRIHWAGRQDGAVRHDGERRVLLVGDAAHPMVPPVGQGASQAVAETPRKLEPGIQECLKWFCRDVPMASA